MLSCVRRCPIVTVGSLTGRVAEGAVGGWGQVSDLKDNVVSKACILWLYSLDNVVSQACILWLARTGLGHTGCQGPVVCIEREREMYYICIYVSFGWREPVWVMQGLRVGCAWRAVRVGVGRLRATRGQRWVFDCSIPGCLQGERWHCYSTDAHPVGDTSVTRLSRGERRVSRVYYLGYPRVGSKRVIAHGRHPCHTSPSGAPRRRPVHSKRVIALNPRCTRLPPPPHQAL